MGVTTNGLRWALWPEDAKRCYVDCCQRKVMNSLLQQYHLPASQGMLTGAIVVQLLLEQPSTFLSDLRPTPYVGEGFMFGTVNLVRSLRLEQS